MIADRQIAEEATGEGVRLPNYARAIIPQIKITEYLLSFAHRDGRGKAEFFVQFGFSADSWQELAAALLRHAAEHEVTQVEDSPFGTRYVVEGSIFTPDGRMPVIRSVWFIESGEDSTLCDRLSVIQEVVKWFGNWRASFWRPIFWNMAWKGAMSVRLY